MSYTTSRRHRSKSFTTRSVATTGSSSFPFPRLPPVPTTTATTQRASPALALRKAATRSMQQLKATFASCTPQRKRSSTVSNVFDPRTTTTPSCTSPSSSPSARPSTPLPLLSLDDIMGKPNSSTTNSRKLKHRISYPLLMSCSSSPIVEKREDWHKWGVREEEQAVQERDRDGDDEERGRGGNGRVMGLWMDSDDSLVDPKDGGLARSLSRATTEASNRIEYDDVESVYGDEQEQNVFQTPRMVNQRTYELVSRWSTSLSTLEHQTPIAVFDGMDYHESSNSPTHSSALSWYSSFYDSTDSSRRSSLSQPTSECPPSQATSSPSYAAPSLSSLTESLPSTPPASPTNTFGYSFARTPPLTSPFPSTPPLSPISNLSPVPSYRLRPPPPLHLPIDSDNDIYELNLTPVPTPTPTRESTNFGSLINAFQLPPSPLSTHYPQLSPSPDRDVVKKHWFPSKLSSKLDGDDGAASESKSQASEGEKVDWTSSTIGAETTRATTVEGGMTKEMKNGVEEERVGWECLEKVQRRSV